MLQTSAGPGGGSPGESVQAKKYILPHPVMLVHGLLNPGGGRSLAPPQVTPPRAKSLNIHSAMCYVQTSF